jgi:ABC-2 type transport system permease protein
MNALLTLAAKDLRLLLRDVRSGVILLLMPLLLIAVLGLAVGEGFGQKPDARLRISMVDLDAGLVDLPAGTFPNRPWSQVVIGDLATTAGIRLELIPTREEAEKLVRSGKRAAVLVFEPQFSSLLHRCSFLTDNKPTPLNPLFRDGIDVQKLGLQLFRDPTQEIASSIIEQVAQVTMLRVVVPYMIGQAFERVGDAKFITMIGESIPGLRLAYRFITPEALGDAVKSGIQKLFSNYNFTAKTWAGLVRAEERSLDRPENLTDYQAEASGTGILRRGSETYKILVPSYAVSFAFFLVLSTGWLFVAERRQGTLIRLRAAPLSRGQILMGKLLPTLLVSLVQGLFLFLSGWLVFGMSWGSEPLWLMVTICCTSLAATGLAMLVAGFAKTETQVAVYGTLLVLVLAGISGSLLPRDLMPEEMKRIGYITPHSWALDAYAQLLLNPQPELSIITTSCGVLLIFAMVFILLSWLTIRLED